MKLNDFFDEIYCINLDERPDRWEDAKKEFKKIELNVKRFSATKHTVGAIGCRESHLDVIKDAKKNGFDKILILEDDVKFIETDLKLINSILNQLNEIDWDIFYLGASIHPELGILEQITDNILKTNFAYTTHAYAVNSKVFDLILKESKKSNSPIDVFYSEKIVSLNNSFISNPMVAIQNMGYSDILKKEVDYYWFLKFFNILKEKFNIK